ncbi:1-(5-phosphoribosyl)-5-[(5-phosphoribosylamino)methylideneamino] imidazole-4-carboxamide isomerase [Peptoclostridium litorale DSM 5388]|uniref:1-(5-phosphoribosyl)-5-[(5-phosphoribosylamino)methylideneamino] imidazole-4-carboxamide isomerase n=1 Tax=Peptoclostridium litorale DSM 5388 TaxID=1121324 RepID=A0A069RG25_PEPLI|nr:1-(5-phosphoribosyl)-5-[(5-phosphoribosylamino)methylideneamino]imidazole-4-carboxamide isomerase [Peptoclostridium litorale]KDR95105.1 1-(5-phosphoribosyl)-5-[(5-phosphoribosylamino)methylideneamino] imidazole-4-carboxamide isomerase HisA [Peptoclostridium litorale DSM 5388]SIN74932.1 1-(5-phosphoribosyl)-5-[(5-phosphoribosylamino)methylideneamino] imidazole-4-carboxamide isomerase [Peptoclostridium litorale DSM 5388]
MILYPAIDIKDGKCVRLKQGKFDDITTYYENPFEAATLWKEGGADYIHIVDLDGALEGVSKNIDVIGKIASKIDVPVQVGGGIRSVEAAKALLESGVSRFIVGTIAIKDRELLKNMVEQFGDKVVVGIDAKDGKVAIDGWENVSSKDSLELAKELQEMGVNTIVYTDISKDGMMSGPNFEVYEMLKKELSLQVIASGGVSSIDDLKKLNDIGVDGAIIGKALYNGAIDFKEAKKIVEVMG